MNHTYYNIRAYHTLTLPDGTFVSGPVVVQLDERRQLLTWHLLHGEEPFTIWVGGHFDARKREKTHPDTIFPQKSLHH